LLYGLTSLACFCWQLIMQCGINKDLDPFTPFS
jgi:hypothetical protein